MRFLQIVVQGLFAVFAVLFGLLAAAVVAGGALVIVLARRLRPGPSGTMPRPPKGERRNSPRDGDAIEVSATEVTTNSAARPAEGFI